VIPGKNLPLRFAIFAVLGSGSFSNIKLAENRKKMLRQIFDLWMRVEECRIAGAGIVFFQPPPLTAGGLG